MTKKRPAYLTFKECCSVVQQLGIRTKNEYKRRYTEDASLPSAPDYKYKSEWLGWSHFLGNTKRVFYGSLAEASQAAQLLGITSSVDYRNRCREDSRLPVQPDQTYKCEWQDWFQFLAKDKNPFYSSLAEASEAAQQLGITSSSEYRNRYREDSRLPGWPKQFYKADWQDWYHFLAIDKITFYSSLAEAIHATQRLGITSSMEYHKRYREDSRLPVQPGDVYPVEWQDWYHFLGKTKKDLYGSLAEASQAAQQLGIKSSNDYRNRCREDSRLPVQPHQTYKCEWQGWYHFLGNTKREFYGSLAEASQAARYLGISSSTEYPRRYKEDACLPIVPFQIYKSEWVSWAQFLGTSKTLFYPTLAEASQAARHLAISSCTEYKRRYKEDARLPSCPAIIFKSEWLGWPRFLENSKPTVYSTLAKASQVARKLSISSGTEYYRRYKEDTRLPAKPSQKYKSEWRGWPQFLGIKKAEFCSTLAEASQLAQKLGIVSYTEYSRSYKRDDRLPSTPDVFYSADWQSWTDFLLPKNITTLEVLKQACKVLNIKDSRDYRIVRKEHKMLPAHPERLIGWIDWYDLLDIPVPYEYQKLASMIRKAGCNNLDDYKKFRSNADDPKIPASPQEVYEKSGWTNTYDFFGKPRPYQTKYLDSQWEAWAKCITEFLKHARGGATKQQELCQFVREYIQAEELDNSPYDFLTRTKVNVKPLIYLLNQLPVHKKKRQLSSINEFLDWVILTELTIEDELTGEILRLKNAANPFKNINFDNEQNVPIVNETQKSSLPYQFVKAGRDWIFPIDSLLENTSYSDLPHLQKFPADWIQISDPTKLDYNDPDCVIITEQDKVYLWNPIFWTYTYALMQLPARGKQIVYCDSGEMDSDIPEFKDGKLLWLENPSEKAGLTKRQGMIYKTESGDFGVHYTSNKTQLFGEGYDIPYMPTELAYWLVKLRKWQQKYNPIEKPTPWLECTRTNLNETQRTYKGSNCFLFRDMYDKEPGTFGGRLTDRLAATLFFAVKDEVTLATYGELNYREVGEQLETEPSIALYRFNSSFTPHSMRVSLINAYAFEFGLPIEVIVKLVGHASMVMTLYYLKSGLVRQKVELGEKQALKDSQERAQRFLEEYGIEEFRTQLTANNPEILNSLSNKIPSSVYLWKDFGICPVGGNSCSSGGDKVVVGANIHNPVAAGYIGEQNCPRCRFFITGPAFLIGQVALYNEITLALCSQSSKHTDLQKNLLDVVAKIEIISHRQYEQQKNGIANPDLAADKELLQSKRRKLNSEIETRAKKMDMFLTDLNFLYRHIHNSRTITKNLRPTDKNKLMLVISEQLAFDVELEESTHFRLLSEVCENAEIFQSCSNELALAKRSQALDKLMVNNEMKPQLLLLDEREQIIIGNQLTQLMYSRIQSWETIDRLIDGDLTFKDLDSDIHLAANDIKEIFSSAKPIGIG